MRRFEKKTIAVAFSLLMIAFSLMMTACLPKQGKLAPPRITSPLYKGAEVVEVWGFSPKAKITIYADGADIGGDGCWFSKCTFKVKALSEGQKITATQTVGGATSHPTRAEHVVTIEKIPDKYLDPKYKKERLLPPEIDAPLYECQGILPVKNVVPGALVQVISPPNTNTIGRQNTPWTYARPKTSDLLKKDQKIAANQTLFFSSPSDLSLPAEIVKKAEAKTVPTPEINKSHLVVGSDTIEVRNLLIGAKVDIYYEEQGKAQEIIKSNFAPWPATIFPVQPLKAAWAACTNCIKADQSLCKITSTSAGKTVKNSLDPLIIKEPVCAGSSEVTVCDFGPNPLLRLFLKGSPDKQISQQGAEGVCAPVTLGDKLYLNNKDEIYVTQRVGTLENKSDTVKVVDKSNPRFEIGDGTFCKPCSGQDYGPIIVRDTLTTESGPEFQAIMCGAESASVEILGPNDALIGTIKLTETKGKKGYFVGTWDWNKTGWKTSKDIPVGKYTAKFKISPSGTGTEQAKYFYVNTKGCVESEVLCAHNKYREQVNKENPTITPLAPLTWSDKLADDAQKWANYLDKTNKFVHEKNISDGENLCGGSTYTDAIDHCASEKSEFKNGVWVYCPNKCPCAGADKDKDCAVSTTCNWCDVGHYSQIVWRDTKQVGCGMGKSFVVCRYSPPGNMAGKKAY